MNNVLNNFYLNYFTRQILRYSAALHSAGD
jgi:hypothetical protein